MRDLLILVPGILGSVLEKDNRAIWAYNGRTAATAITTRGAYLREMLTLQADDANIGELDDGITATRLMPDLHLLPGLSKIDGYSRIRKRLVADLGLLPGYNYREFPYDWRRDNAYNGQRLADFCTTALSAWRHRSPSARMIIIAHSMGGLIAKYFLDVLEGWRTGGTRALVTLGTPFRGSANALDVLCNGLHSRLVDLTAMSQSFTSLYQLLPIYPSYEWGNGGLERVGEITGVRNVDANRAANALNFHRLMDRAAANAQSDHAWATRGYIHYTVVGRGQQTLHRGIESGSKVEMSTLYDGKEWMGDGTVPLASGIPLNFDRTDRRADLYVGVKHGSLQNSDVVLDHIIGRIQDLFRTFDGFRSLRAHLPGEEEITLRAPSDPGLDVPDLLTCNDRVRVLATTSLPGVITITDANSRLQVAIERLDTSVNQTLEFDPLPPGKYVVRVTNNSHAQIEDVIAVSDCK